MSPNFQALCYLTAWENDAPIEGGLAWQSQLRKCRLDYSWASLERIDYFLGALRDQRAPTYESFLAEQANVNLLIFLAFYVVELRSRVSGQPARWLTYEEAVTKDCNAEVYGRGFHSMLIAEQGSSQFLPLVSVCARLFESGSDKSVAFSAGTHIQPPEDKNKCFTSLPPTSLIPDFNEKFQSLAIPAGYRRWIEAPYPSYWSPSDPLARLRTDSPKLLRAGRVVWGAIVQANGNLSDPTFLECAPGEIVYDPMGKVDRIDLYHVGRRLRELGSAAQSDPSLEIYGNHLRAETSRIFGWLTPQSLYPYELQASTTMFSGEVSFPGYALVSPLIPILVSEECPGSVIIAPWQLWPRDVFKEWNDALRSKFGGRATIHSQP